MTTDQPHPDDVVVPVTGGPQTIVIQHHSSGGRFAWFRSWVIYSVLSLSLLANLVMYSAYQDYFSEAGKPVERYHSGDKESQDKLAVIRISGTIMPPYTSHTLKDIQQAKDDSHVKGVLLVIDSPGGFVSDSHQIYHKLVELRAVKPIVVSMRSLAASGGYYVAMGAGPKARIFAEPTTWTGSIGVIIPHYEFLGPDSPLAKQVGFKAAPLKTGEFKDTLSPFRELTTDEQKVWRNMLDQSYEQFLSIIDEGRDTLNPDQIRKLATGQVFTARDAKANGLIDEIGFEEDALAELKKQTGLQTARVVMYYHQAGLLEVLTGAAQGPSAPKGELWQGLMEATVPRAMYYFSWGGLLPLPGAPGAR